MKKVLLFIVMLLLCSISASALVCTVNASNPPFINNQSSGTTYPHSGYWNGSHYFYSEQAGTYARNILRYDVGLAGRTAVKTSTPTYVNGITGNGTYYWVTDSSSDAIYVYDSAWTQLTTWSVASGAGGPCGATVDPASITNNGTHLFMICDGQTDVYRYNITNSTGGISKIAASNFVSMGVTLKSTALRFFYYQPCDVFLASELGNLTVYSSTFTEIGRWDEIRLRTKQPMGNGFNDGNTIAALGYATAPRWAISVWNSGSNDFYNYSSPFDSEPPDLSPPNITLINFTSMLQGGTNCSSNKPQGDTPTVTFPDLCANSSDFTPRFTVETNESAKCRMSYYDINYTNMSSFGGDCTNATFGTSSACVWPIPSTPGTNKTFHFSCVDSSGNVMTAPNGAWQKAIIEFWNNVTIKWDAQVPQDITTTNIISIGVNITYNVTFTSLSSDTNGTIELFYKTNTSSVDGTIYLNGSLRTGWSLGQNYTSALGKKYKWYTDEADILPATYNFDQDAMERTLHIKNSSTTASSAYAIEFLNFSNSSSNVIFEIMMNSSAASPIRIYYANDQYLFSGNTQVFTEGANITLIGSRAGGSGTTWDHCHIGSGTIRSCHYFFSVPLNTTTGEINGVKVSPTSYFIARGATGGTSYAMVVANWTRVNATRKTLNAGTAWSTRTYTVDAHPHFFNGSESFWYQACVNNTAPIQRICDPERRDLLVQGGLPPTTPLFFYPTDSLRVTENITINWSMPVSPNGFPINNTNISLLDSSYVYSTMIRGYNGLNTTYYWSTATNESGGYIADGSYILRICSKDNNSLEACNYQPFSISNNAAYFSNYTFFPNGNPAGNCVNAPDTNLVLLTSMNITWMNAADGCRWVGCFNFTSNSAWLRVTANSGYFDYTGSGNRSWFAWVKIPQNGLVDNTTFFGKATDTSGYYVGTSSTHNKLSCYLNGASTYPLKSYNISKPNVSDGNWHFVGCTYNSATSQLKGWMDGDLQFTESRSGLASPGNSRWFGIGSSVRVGVINDSAPKYGLVDTLLNWDRELREDEIIGFNNSGPAYITTNTVNDSVAGFWLMGNETTHEAKPGTVWCAMTTAAVRTGSTLSNVTFNINGSSYVLRKDFFSYTHFMQRLAGTYSWNFTASTNVGRINSTPQESYVIVTYPLAITLLEPLNNPVVNLTGWSNFSWLASNKFALSGLSCNISINSSIEPVNSLTTDIVSNITTTFGNGVSWWNVTCSDTANNYNTSETYYFTSNNITAVAICAKVWTRNATVAQYDNTSTPIYRPASYTSKQVRPIQQNSSVSIFRIENVCPETSTTLNLTLNSSNCQGVEQWCGLTNLTADAFAITTTKKSFNIPLGYQYNQSIWCWINFSYPRCSNAAYINFTIG